MWIFRGMQSREVGMDRKLAIVCCKPVGVPLRSSVPEAGFHTMLTTDGAEINLAPGVIGNSPTSLQADGCHLEE